VAVLETVAPVPPERPGKDLRGQEQTDQQVVMHVVAVVAVPVQQHQTSTVA
jgi:hypothetical protein